MNWLYSAAVVWAALSLCQAGGVFSARSGVMPFAMPGMVALGLSAGKAALGLLPWENEWSAVLSVLIAGITGAALSLPMAMAAGKKKGSMLLRGLGLSCAGFALSLLIREITKGQAALAEERLRFLTLRLPYFEGSVFLPAACLIVAVSLVVLRGTRFGLRVKLCGVDAGAARDAGIFVGRVRAKCLLLCGFLCGAAGMAWDFGPESAMLLGLMALLCGAAGKWKIGFLLLLSLPVSLLWGVSLFPEEIGLSLSQEALRLLPCLGALLLWLAAGRGSDAGLDTRIE